MAEINIGKKLQTFRAEKGMSIRELAQASGVTASMLSQIERGLANPSIKTLKDISETLNVPLYLFFKEEEETEIVVRKDKRRTMGKPEEQDTVYSLLTPGSMGNIEFCIMELHEGAESAKMVSHIGEEVAYVLDGPIEVYVDENHYVLETGDSIRIAPQSLHKWANHSEKAAKIIFAISPPSF
jgi:transcriptional regulator with XRE-family HTH domain